MKPELSEYKIVADNNKFWVEHKYDLFTGYNWHRINLSFETALFADVHLHKVYENHLAEYERLKKQGRSFPDNE